MFRFQLSEDQRSLTILVEEQKFDITLASGFRQQVDDVWKDSIESVTVDFTSVEFIDSSGIGALVSVHKRVAVKGSALKIINPSPGVTSVVELLRLHRVFNMVTV